ncbi:MAG: hypothetical protein ALECFALPRED_001696 [Alectoria fallacina]|uniref:Uncharacterized protein n=1 Tax=Alectoria fallacina TaxID=1903189 RepID=A0A8H3FFP4_9LECA|nr:MAG: hypothetical protein ALECFALPRED_001696 [Alectoria fallacina]
MGLSRARLRAIKASKTDEDDVRDPVITVLDLMFASERDLNDLLEGYHQEEASNLFQISREQYAADRDADTRGTANPSIMNNPFWMFQVGPRGLPAWSARTTFGNPDDPLADSEDPVWCFIRFGATRTKLPDGRVVCIGGEHEDGYDPDFCIYNDVVVFETPPKSVPPPLLTPECIKIYGYPVDIFPPTDFHTSTYFADPATGKEWLIIIGGLGYGGQASREQTDVYQLDLTDFSIQRLHTSGIGPIGGTHHHKAELVGGQGQAAIRITTEEVKELVDKEGGKDAVMTEEGEETFAMENIRESIVSDIGQESTATVDGRDSLSEEESEGSITTPPPTGKELVTTTTTTKESQVFTLRFHDMRWI